MCTLTTGFIRGCADNIGGIKRFYVANKPSDFAVTANASGTATDISGTGLSWFQYQPRRENSFWNEAPTKDAGNGTTWYDQTATIVLNIDNQTKANEVDNLAKAELVLIVEDRNGRYFLLGETDGMVMETSSRGSGTAMSDLNGYTLNFKAYENAKAREVQYAAFSAEISSTTGDT